jgi:hypothetical protein
MRIALFTPYSPEIGGGSVQLRSLLSELRELGIEWFYLAKSAATSQQGYWLGLPFTTRQFLSDLCARTGFLPGSRALVRNLTNHIQADLYWVVAHNEGISLAAELCAMGKRVHLTVHDDPICMFRRSRKYRAFAPLISLQFSRLLKSVESVDVISSWMRDSYKQKYEVDSFPVYRFVPELPPISFQSSRDTLAVGHIGSLYHPEPFRYFLSACRQFASEKKLAFKVVRIGSSPEVDQVASAYPHIFENCGEQDEGQAITRLALCDFLYAMYPSGSRFQCFRQTSLPMKLSTYVQAQRPIFAHTPGDSGLAQLIEKYGVGTVCSSHSEDAIQQAIKGILQAKITRYHFEALRSDLMGPDQLILLKNALTGKHLA